MQYFRILTDDSMFGDRWFLNDPRTEHGDEIDAREFAKGKAYHGARPTTVPIYQEGRRVEFSLGSFDMPVVSERIARLIETNAASEVECFPIMVASSIPGYEILNAVCREACVDEQRSLVTRWQPGDFRPDRIGKYRMVSNVTSDPSRTHDRHIFRVEDFEIALIVSEEIRVALEKIGSLGVVFRAVC